MNEQKRNPHDSATQKLEPKRLKVEEKKNITQESNVLQINVIRLFGFHKFRNNANHVEVIP